MQQQDDVIRTASIFKICGRTTLMIFSASDCKRMHRQLWEGCGFIKPKFVLGFRGILLGHPRSLHFHQWTAVGSPITEVACFAVFKLSRTVEPSMYSNHAPGEFTKTIKGYRMNHICELDALQRPTWRAPLGYCRQKIT